jgi:transposase
MIPHGVEVFVGIDPIDLRWGFHRLAGVVTEQLGRDARGGALFVFFGKRREAMKVLFWDGTGMCLFYKRLDKGTFRIPLASDGARVVTLGEREFDDLLDGIDVEMPVVSTTSRRRATTH